MKQLSVVDVANIFANLEGTPRFSVTLPQLPYAKGKLLMKIEVDGVKVPNPYFGRVTRILRVCGIAGDFKYENMINNDREKAGLPRDFNEGSHLWGERVNGVILKADGPDILCYLRIGRPKFKALFFLDGMPVTHASTLKSIFATRCARKASDTYVNVKLIPGAVIKLKETYIIQ